MLAIPHQCGLFKCNLIAALRENLSLQRLQANDFSLTVWWRMWCSFKPPDWEKSFLAQHAFIRFLTGVSSDVQLENTFSFEKFITNVATERPFIRMTTPNMSSERISLEQSITQLACDQCFTSVFLSAMVIQTTFSPVSLVAHTAYTFQQCLASMNSHVFCQSILRLKSLSTLCAWHSVCSIISWSGMNSVMVLQSAWTRKSFFTKLTGKWFFSIVYFVMVLQSAWTKKSFFTKLTGIWLFSIVYSQMDFQIFLALKIFIALITAEWFFSGMNFSVSV